MKITEIRVHINNAGSDIVYISTDLPQPIYPFNEELIVNFYVARNQGIEYCKNNFHNVNIFSICMKTGEKKLIQSC